MITNNEKIYKKANELQKETKGCQIIMNLTKILIIYEIFDKPKPFCLQMLENKYLNKGV